jgi:bis(5'-nucleosyl)-tetraphosphatase (symmetrical)
MGYGDAARCLLGNHDLNLLAVAQGVRKPHRKDTLHTVLDAPDRTAMLAGCASNAWPCCCTGVLLRC